jgi:hypothetical protein
MGKKNSFWIRVKELMESRRITVVMLALLLDVQPKILRKWMFWNHVPDDFCKCKIANTFGVSQEFLIHGKIGTEKSGVNFTDTDDVA